MKELFFHWIICFFIFIILHFIFIERNSWMTWHCLSANSINVKGHDIMQQFSYTSWCWNTQAGWVPSFPYHFINPWTNLMPQGHLCWFHKIQLSIMPAHIITGLLKMPPISYLHQLYFQCLSKEDFSPS